MPLQWSNKKPDCSNRWFYRHTTGTYSTDIIRLICLQMSQWYDSWLKFTLGKQFAMFKESTRTPAMIQGCRTDIFRRQCNYEVQGWNWVAMNNAPVRIVCPFQDILSVYSSFQMFHYIYWNKYRQQGARYLILQAVNTKESVPLHKLILLKYTCHVVNTWWYQHTSMVLSHPNMYWYEK